MDVVKIKYEIEDSELDRLIKKYNTLDKESEDLVKGFRAINKEAAQAGVSMTNFGNKTEQAAKKSKNAISQTKKDLNDLNTGASKIAGMIAGYFTFQAVTSLGKQIIEVTAEFEKFRAVLTNTLGSQAAADLALDLIQDFAATTNFSVQELTSSFIKLTNSGFQPTKDELTLLADLANSTGKSFDQLTEAILDANTFQFERLKEFGIKAEQEGNKIRFTFKGVTTEVAKTSQSVQEYLLGLGKLEGVSGSTAAISATLTGQISNLGDSYDQLLLSIGKQGRGGVSEAVGFLNNILGELKKSVEGQPSAFDPFVQSLNGLWNISKDLFSTIGGIWQQFQGLFGEVKEGNLLMQGLAYTFKVAFVPIKLLIQGVVTLADAFKVLSNSRQNLINLIKGEPLIDSGIDKLKKDLLTINDILLLQDGEVNKIREESAKQDVEITKKKEAQKTQITKEEIDKRFKAEMESLDKLEKLTIDRAKIDGATEADIIRIQEDFNGRREGLFKRYGKTREIDYQFLLLREKQLEIEYTEFLTKEEESRRKARLELRDQQLKDIESRQAQQKTIDTQYFNSRVEEEFQSLKRGEINLIQYTENVERITREARRKELQDAIDANDEKLDVTLLGKDAELQIIADTSEKQRQLNELEVEEFKKKEDEKTKKLKEEEDKRREIQERSFELFGDLVNASFEIRKNQLSAEQEALRANTDEQIKLAGDNEKKKAEIQAQAEARERALKRRQAEVDRNQAIFTIGITTALNVVKALGQPPIPGTNVIAAAIAAASGAAQLAVVLSRPLPKFAKGTKRVTGGEKGKDSVHALLMPDEAVIPADQAQHPSLKPIIGGIIDRTLDPRDIVIRNHKSDIGKGVHRDEPLYKELKGMRKDLKKLKQLNITVDKNGVGLEQISGNTRTKILNDYFND